MKRDHILKHIALAFGIAVVVYVCAYALDRHLRLRNGPWRVTFQTESNGTPAIAISQARLGVSDLRIIFPGENLGSNALPSTIVFDAPAKIAPWGEVIFDDLMYLPGTVTFNLFGHEIELLPRVLIVDRREHSWAVASPLSLSPANKPATILKKAPVRSP